MNAKPVRMIVLPNGKRCSLRAYVDSWKQLKAANPSETVGGFSDFPVSAGSILYSISKGVLDRINQRGGVIIRDVSESRLHKRIAERVRGECQWCGAEMSEYKQKSMRFCSRGCCASYRS